MSLPANTCTPPGDRRADPQHASQCGVVMGGRQMAFLHNRVCWRVASTGEKRQKVNSYNADYLIIHCALSPLANGDYMYFAEHHRRALVHFSPAQFCLAGMDGEQRHHYF